MVRQVDLFVVARGAGSRAGSVQFYRLPVQVEVDFRSEPPGLLTLDEARAVSLDLVAGRQQGTVGRYSWVAQWPPP